MYTTVIGFAYVGMSLAAIQACQHRVIALDIDEGRATLVNAGRSSVTDTLIAERLANDELRLPATTSPVEACVGANFVIVATPLITTQSR